MALPIIPLIAKIAQRVAMVAISEIPGGVIKTAIRRSINYTIKEMAIQKTLKPKLSRDILFSLDKLKKYRFSDIEATLINRLKTQPTKALKKYVANQIGIDTRTLDLVLKSFKQTPEMRRASLGKAFRLTLNRLYLKGRNNILKDLGLQKGFKIVNFYKQVKALEKAQKRYEKALIKRNIQNMLKTLNRLVSNKLNGISEPMDKYKQSFRLKFNFSKLYDSKKEYTKDNVDMLLRVIESLDNDIEHYLPGSGDSPYLVEIRPGVWSIYTKRSAIQFIKSVEEEVKFALE